MPKFALHDTRVMKSLSKGGEILMQGFGTFLLMFGGAIFGMGLLFRLTIGRTNQGRGSGTIWIIVGILIALVSLAFPR